MDMETEQTISQQKHKNSVQELKNLEQEQKITSLETANYVQQQMMANLSSSQEDVKHTETGRIYCHSSEF